MSKGLPCLKPAEHRAEWRVRHRQHNHSQFARNGYEESPYSEVACDVCLADQVNAAGVWRTRAAYVNELPGECSWK